MSVPETFRCASCQDGKYKRDIINPEPSDLSVLDGYWFCAWCYQYTDDKQLVSRAENGEVQPLFSEAEMESGTTSWDDPEEKFID